MLQYIDRETKEKKEEKVYGKWLLRLLYVRFLGIGNLLRPFITRSHLFSTLFGRYQKSARSQKKVLPFIEEYGVDASEFEKKPEEFASFNDFFIRELKPECRPIGSTAAVMPADARYLFFENICNSRHFFVKGQKMNLSKLLGDPNLGEQYEGGTLIFARLCPLDYHRFHFPCDCTAGQPRLINGMLKSVNPIALKRNLSILWKNKRVVTPLETEAFGTVQMVEVGATNVGSIVQTAKPSAKHKKGEEKGYFEFGGSCVILLFKKGTIKLESDLHAPEGIEIFSKMGTTLGEPCK